MFSPVNDIYKRGNQTHSRKVPEAPAVPRQRRPWRGGRAMLVHEGDCDGKAGQGQLDVLTGPEFSAVPWPQTNEKGEPCPPRIRCRAEEINLLAARRPVCPTFGPDWRLPRSGWRTAKGGPPCLRTSNASAPCSADRSHTHRAPSCRCPAASTACTSRWSGSAPRGRTTGCR